jgi:hypothetical protein
LPNAASHHALKHHKAIEKMISMALCVKGEKWKLSKNEKWEGERRLFESLSHPILMVH